MFTQTLDGFGVTGGFGYTETKIEDAFGNIDQIPVIPNMWRTARCSSKTTGINARASARYRSKFSRRFHRVRWFAHASDCEGRTHYRCPDWLRFSGRYGFGKVLLSTFKGKT